MDYGKTNHFWQSLNLLLAPILFTLLIIFRQDMPLWMWLMALHLPILMIHEVEEYVLAPKSFKEFVNVNSPLGSGKDPDFPLDEAYVFQVNILIAWPVIILGAVLANVAPWIGMSMIWFQIVINNVMHTVGFQTGKPTYNPGLLTNCLITPVSPIFFAHVNLGRPIFLDNLMQWWHCHHKTHDLEVYDDTNNRKSRHYSPHSCHAHEHGS